METYAARILDGIVQEVIVGDANWAMDRLGGLWIDTDTLVGIGWTWNEIEGFQRPQDPDIEV